ncbi:heterokaryon incompatibility protein-domain-containing protein [Ustulina deusta]|nr:heterokaryon incompatibility protein-domain-containing protein [Ustulina deusta]
MSCRGDFTWYPSRLLDVLGSESETFKIVDGHDIPPGFSYITLSHRWGAAIMPRLTVRNMSYYRAGALISGLPRTFQDTITITRRLGARYLWIDSLCIIQDGDDGRDWMQEAPQMAHIYSKCLLNISADWGVGEQGLFFDRELDFSRTFEMEFCVSPGRQKRGQKRRRRGWVFQERILSPVIIHFGRREVLWECCQKLASESLPSGLSNIPHIDMRSLSQSMSLKRLDPSGDPHISDLLSQAFRSTPLRDSTIHDTPYLLWWFLIRKYCQCALTYASDRLVAISGVARCFKSIIKDQHVVGMWRKYLAIEVGWTMKSTTSGRILQDSRYTRPSFSWTSAEGLIEPGNPVYDRSISPCVEVEPVEALLPSSEVSTAYRPSPSLVLEDIFGPLTKPCVQIRVKGNLKSAKLLRSQRKWLVVPMENGDSDGEEIEKFPGVQAQLDFIPSETDEEEFQRRQFFYMPWYTYDSSSLTCFMLLDLQRAQTREFCRIGVCRP